MKRSSRAKGLTVLELVIATTMLSMVLATISVVMRTSRAAWEAHEADFTRLEAAHATLRHIVRLARQAEAVTAISAANDQSGALTLRMPTGELLAWDHDGNTGTMYFGVNSATDLLSDGITTFNVRGYRADGVTATSQLDQIQCLLLTLTVTLPRDVQATRTLRSWVTIRAW